jgi:iron-sulfur cluster assembly protein
MGTFHDDMGELHGITVVAQAGPTVYVGRCHEMDADNIVLLDVDQHTAGPDGKGEDGRSHAEYLERAAKFGVWKKHDRLVVPMVDVQAVTPLGAYYEGVGKTAAATPAAAAAPSQQDEPDKATATATATDSPVVVTDDASQEVRRLLAEEENAGQGLRLGVSGGGCSGLVYKVEFDSRQDGDIVVPGDGFEIFLDRKSIIYLRGITLDFKQGLSGRGFQFQNPNASNTCGCGESFAV